MYDMESCSLTKTQLNLLNYVISSSFRKIFIVSSNEIVYLCRSVYNCSNIEDILCIRGGVEPWLMARCFIIFSFMCMLVKIFIIVFITISMCYQRLVK